MYLYGSYLPIANESKMDNIIQLIKMSTDEWNAIAQVWYGLMSGKRRKSVG